MSDAAPPIMVGPVSVSGEDGAWRVLASPIRTLFLARALRHRGLTTSVEEKGNILADCNAKELADALAWCIKPELICLDVDGCLIDVSKSFDMVVKAVVRSFTDKEVTTAEITALRNEGGYNDDNVLSQELIRQRGVEVELDRILPVFRNFYVGGEDGVGLYREEKPIITTELLTRLLNNYSVSLVTGRNHEEVALAYPVLDLPKDTPAITIDDVKAGKPDPEGILLAAERAKASRFWMIGDNRDDILAARSAGAIAIGVGGSNRTVLEQAGAAIVLNDINQVEALL